MLWREDFNAKAQRPSFNQRIRSTSLACHHNHAGPGGRVPQIPGVPKRGEHGSENITALTFRHDILGLPLDTVIGEFAVYVKYEAADMWGTGYYLPAVPYVMYFFEDYGLHGTYWHSNFGTPMSHGCVNLRTEDAGWLFNWASVGTRVVVHD